MLPRECSEINVKEPKTWAWVAAILTSLLLFFVSLSILSQRSCVRSKRRVRLDVRLIARVRAAPAGGGVPVHPALLRLLQSLRHQGDALHAELLVQDGLVLLVSLRFE